MRRAIGIAISLLFVFASTCVACGSAIGELTRPVPQRGCPPDSVLTSNGHCRYIGSDPPAASVARDAGQ